MSKILKLREGRAHDPKMLTIELLGELSERTGGLTELRRVVAQCEAIPRRALERAWRRARRENVLASVGESLIGMAVLASVLWMVSSPLDLPYGELAVWLFTPTTIALVVHIAVQRVWHARWSTEVLLPTLERRSEREIVGAALTFYQDVARRMALPGLCLYVLTTAITLPLVSDSIAAWCVVLPMAALCGWVVNCVQYYTRLLHADPREWFEAFAIDLSPEGEAAIRDARKGRGACRFLADRIEAHGYTRLVPFDAYLMIHCLCGLVASLVILAGMVVIAASELRLMIAVPAAVGLHVVACSHLLRVEFLNRRIVTPPDGRQVRAGTEDSAIAQATERDVELRSQEFRRAMP